MKLFCWLGLGALIAFPQLVPAADENVSGNLSITGGGKLAVSPTTPADWLNSPHFLLQASLGSPIFDLRGPSGSNPFMSFTQGTSRRGYFAFANFGQEMKFAAEFGNVSFYTALDGNEQPRALINGSGNFGIGPFNQGNQPAALLHLSAANSPEIRSQGGSSGSPFFSFYQGATRRGFIELNDNGKTLKLSSESGPIELYSSNNAVPRLKIDSNGNVGIGTSNPTTKLAVEGEAMVQVLNITGGSDLSEQFRVRFAASGKRPEAGMIVCIDPQNPGELKVSSSPYDKTVAGIISGAGGLNVGMRMGQAGSLADGDFPVALSGRVYCMVDATEQAVKPGDLLTTSNKPGMAMKVDDYGRAQGAVLGKAMTAIDKGETGLVLVLVNLQ